LNIENSQILYKHNDDCIDGSQYEGDWVNNMRHGIGTLMAADGTIYQGEFWNNMKQVTEY
jgi:hypothetical protein